MKTLTKKYRLIYEGKTILNKDYKDEQQGATYLPDNIDSFETDIQEELDVYITANNLSLTAEDKRCELDESKAKKLTELSVYDESEDVNSFIFQGQKMWFTSDVRISFRSSIDSAKTLGEQFITLPIGITLPIDTADVILAQVQRYADAAYLVTNQHKANIIELKNIDDVKKYDITVGYPPILNFDEMG